MSFATCSGSPCCRCASSGTLPCWTLVLGGRFTHRDGIEPSLRLVKRPREPSKRSTAKGFIHRSPRIGVPSWMPLRRWYRFPRHFPQPTPSQQYCSLNDLNGAGQGRRAMRRLPACTERSLPEFGPKNDNSDLIDARSIRHERKVCYLVESTSIQSNRWMESR